MDKIQKEVIDYYRTMLFSDSRRFLTKSGEIVEIYFQPERLSEKTLYDNEEQCILEEIHFPYE